MTSTKTITVPFIEGLEDLDLQELDLAMENGASKFSVNENNWPEAAPYAPDCCGSIARSATHMVVMYHVRGLDLRARTMQDNVESWLDSCCEFFVSHPTDGTYYNFEMTCIGTLLGGKRKSRTDSHPIDLKQLARVKRLCSLERRQCEFKDEIFSWTVAMVIPFDVMGIDKDNLPSTLRGNFYKCGDLTAHPHFLSWNPVGTPAPDFHRPEFFGKLVLS